MRKRFCIYEDRIDLCDDLSDQEVGRLYRALMATWRTGERQELAGRESVAYNAMVRDMTQDAQKASDKSAKCKSAVEKRWKKSIRTNTNVYERIQTYTDVYERMDENKKTLQDKDFLNADNDGECKETTIYISNISNSISNTDKSNSKSNRKRRKDIEKEKDIYCRVIDHLNAKTGARYRAGTKSTCDLISGRLRDGHTEADVIAVIDVKCAEWLGTDMATYLRPETLFCPKHFESYLNQARIKAAKSTNGPWGNVGKMV